MNSVWLITSSSHSESPSLLKSSHYVSSHFEIFRTWTKTDWDQAKDVSWKSRKDKSHQHHMMERPPRLRPEPVRSRRNKLFLMNSPKTDNAFGWTAKHFKTSIEVHHKGGSGVEQPATIHKIAGSIPSPVHHVGRRRLLKSRTFTKTPPPVTWAKCHVSTHTAVPGRLLLTNGDGGDLSVEIQHAVAVHIHQVVPPAFLVVTEEIDRTDILERDIFTLKP